MSKHGIVAALTALLLSGRHCRRARFRRNHCRAGIADCARAQPLQGLLRRPVGAGPFPAVVLLHSCNGNWKKLDERWGRQIAPWGYVTLTVDSFGPRGIDNTCGNGTPADMAFDAYRALDFLVRQHAVDPDRVAVLGFSQGGWLALSSVEQGVVEHSSSNKFRAAAAFYPNCRTIQGQSDRAGADHDRRARRLDLGRGLPAGSRRATTITACRGKREGAPIKLIVYPGAYHAFDSPALKTPKELFGHRLEYNQAAADQSAVALREFLDAIIGGKESGKLKIKAVVFDAYGTLYDVQSVAEITEEAFPGYGEIITQIWRIKQLEYSWLRTLMRHYADFAAVTRDSLAYTLRCLGLQYDRETFDAIIAKYRHLDLYPDARETLDALGGRKLAILSNGSPEMLNALVKNSGLDDVLDATLSVDSHEGVQAESGRLHPDRIRARRQTGRGVVRVVEPLGRLRRQILRPQRRLDRAGDARSDGAGLRRERSRGTANDVQGDPDADG